MITGVLLLLMASTMSAQTKLRADNIDEVLKAMTIEEKAKLMVGGANNFFGAGAVVGGEADLVAGAAGTTPRIERLGIPATVLTDGPAGVRIDPTREGTTQTYYATAFPIGSCLASTWNTELVSKVGEAIGNETKEYRCDVILGPGMNLHRNPLCGRNFEYYSEDPLVTGKIAAAYIKGVQSQGAGVSAKHFAVNSQETDRTAVDERVSQRAARELYLRGFEIAVRESNPWTIMASYNKVNGEFSMGNHDLLTKILREDWGYKGIVMTDWIGIRNGLPTINEVHAGNDLMEPGQPAQVREIVYCQDAQLQKLSLYQQARLRGSCRHYPSECCRRYRAAEEQWCLALERRQDKDGCPLWRELIRLPFWWYRFRMRSSTIRG